MSKQAAKARDKAGPIMLAQLLFEQPPEPVDAGQVAARIASRLPKTRLVSKPGSDTLLYVHENHVVEFEDARVPPQFAVIRVADEPFPPDAVTPAAQQTWNWDAGKQLAPRLRYQIAAMEMMAAPLDYRQRFPLFSNCLLSLVEVTRPAAILCQHAQMLVDPAKILRASGDGADPLAMLMCHLNVRFFNIDGSGGDMLMDTRGLAALGLPDVQMHFRKSLDPGRVAGFLFTVARYLYESGDLIKDGETVEGFPPGERWPCQHEMSLVGPDREVLDVNPGARHAAGKRG
jgi:hypothetical protein